MGDCKKGHKYVGDQVAVGQLEAKEHIRSRTAAVGEGSCRGWSVKMIWETFIFSLY